MQPASKPSLKLSWIRQRLFSRLPPPLLSQCSRKQTLYSKCDRNTSLETVRRVADMHCKDCLKQIRLGISWLTLRDMCDRGARTDEAEAGHAILSCLGELLSIIYLVYCLNHAHDAMQNASAVSAFTHHLVGMLVVTPLLPCWAKEWLCTAGSVPNETRLPRTESGCGRCRPQKPCHR